MIREYLKDAAVLVRLAQATGARVPAPYKTTVRENAMRKLGIQSCVLATAMLFIFAPDAEARSTKPASSSKSATSKPDTETPVKKSGGVTLSTSSSSGSTSSTAATAGTTAAVVGAAALGAAAATAATAKPLSPDEQKRLAAAQAANKANEERLAKEVSEKLLADKIKAEEEALLREKQAAEEKARQDKLERKEKARLAEEQRIKDKKDRERLCVITPVMSDAQIAKCHEVWR